MDSRPLSGHAAHSPIKLEVSLPSGWCETGAVQQLSSIDCLKIAAQQSLGQRFLRLVAPNGRPLDQADCIWFSGLQDGDCLTAFAQQPKIAAARCSAFALWCVGGDRIVTRGDPHYGGDSSRVQHQLRNVQQICSTYSAFAAILADGAVATWGQPDCGGDSSRVQHQLRNVRKICSTDSWQMERW